MEGKKGSENHLTFRRSFQEKMNVLQTYYGNHFSDVTKINSLFFVAKYIYVARFKVSFFDDEDIRDSNFCMLGQWQ